MRYLYIIFGFCLLFTSCDKKDDDHKSVMCSPTIIDNTVYLNAESDPLSLLNTELTIEGCLKVSIQYGGGCSDVFLNLVDSGDVLETQPPQRNLRFIFEDDDQCEALILKDYYFNVEVLKVEGSDEVLLNLQGFDTPLLYDY